VELAEKKKSESKAHVKKSKIEKSEVEGKVTRALKDKDEVEQMAQKVYTTLQKQYKEVPEVLMVVESTMEEKVGNISDDIKGLRTNTIDFEVHATPRKSPEERAQRERTA
jgi:hypothetical protein